MILDWLVYAVAVERCTEILVDSKFTLPLRGWLGRRALPAEQPPAQRWWQRQPWRFLHALLSCGYCTSVWVAMPAAVGWEWPWLVSWMLLHGLAGLVHLGFRIAADLAELVRRGRVNTYDLTVRILPEQPEEE